MFQWCPRHYSPDMNESSWTLLSVSCDFPSTHPLPPAFHHYLFLLTIRFLHPILPSSFFPASPLRCNLNRARIFPLLESDASNMLRPLLVIRGVIGKKPLGLDIQLGARGLHGCSGLSLACKTWPSSAWTTLFRSSGRWPCRCRNIHQQQRERPWRGEGSKLSKQVMASTLVSFNIGRGIFHYVWRIGFWIHMW